MRSAVHDPKQPTDVLPDLLSGDLMLWFVGTAAGPRSAAEGAYYAHPGNRFWRTLHATGITPRQFEPRDWPKLLELGIGLTDLCKSVWGVDADLPRSAFDPDGLAEKVARLRPRGIAFTSKLAARQYLKLPAARINYGRVTPEATGEPGPALFVLPSPSGLASGWWSIEPWLAAADFVARQRRSAPRRRGTLPGR